MSFVHWAHQYRVHAAVLCTWIFAVAAILQGVTAHAQTVSSWTTTRTHAHPTGNAVFQDYLSDSEPMEIVATLKLRNRQQLDATVTGIITPGSQQYRQYLTHEQIVAAYWPTADQAQTVANYLSSTGFSNVQIADNNGLVTATGTAGAVRAAFNTQLAHFSRNGVTGIANTQDVQVPSALGDVVDAVLGLQTLDSAHTGVAITGSEHQLPNNYFFAIYDGYGIQEASSTLVGIIMDGSVTQVVTDLHTSETTDNCADFQTSPTDTACKTLNPTIVQVGSAGTDTTNVDEWDLDSQVIQGVAGEGSIDGEIWYVGTSLADAALTPAYNKAVSDNKAKVINASFGECEEIAASDGAMAADDAIFETAVAQGQTFSFASGDLGAEPCSGNIGVDYPASSPYVIGVGGTTLYTLPCPRCRPAPPGYGGEAAWSGSTGGESSYEGKPSWQDAALPGGTNSRGVPDLAFDADTNTGAYFYYEGSEYIGGGTSLASPIFVGLWARLESAHGNTLGFPAATLYNIGDANTSVFNDITSGCDSQSIYCAGTGWDYVTGLGSFNVSALSSAL